MFLLNRLTCARIPAIVALIWCGCCDPSQAEVSSTPPVLPATATTTEPASSKPDVAQSGEKLIMGFEKDELDTKRQGRTCWTMMQATPDGVDFYAPFEFGEQGRLWTWHCQTGEVTQGKLALVAKIAPGPGPKYSNFRSTPMIDRYYPVLHEDSDATIILNTFQWLAHSGVDVANWSGYDLLRADIRCEADTKIWLAVEDGEIEPPIVCIYQVPAGRWVTLEMDLAQAVKDRQLDLSRIANFWLLGSSGKTSQVRVDNIRIAAAISPAKLDVLRDSSSMKLPPPSLPAKPIVPVLPADVKADRSAIPAVTPVVTIDKASLAPFGWIAAFDNNRLMLGSCLDGKPSACFSKDGGASWEPLPSPAARNLDHGTSRGTVVDETGDVAVVSSGNACASCGVATPRQMLTKYTFDGQTWQCLTPPAVLDCDIRHCGSNAYTVRLRTGPQAGRLWTTWGEVDRFRSLCVHAKFSDDDGLTWNFPGRGGMVPGSMESYFTFNTYGYQQPRCTPYGDGIAVFWQDARGLLWNRFEQGRWGTTEVIDTGAAPLLAPTENEGFRNPGSCVTRGDREIFITAWKVPGVLRWDGKAWQRELAQACDGGVLSLCGGKNLMLFTAGSTEQPPAYKRVKLIKQVPVLCYRRKADGSWDKPLDLSGGPTAIFEYRQMPALVAQPYAPANFCPVAWSSDNTVKLLRVPVLPE